MGIFFFKTPKPRQFKYIPVFYNAEKEALKEREQQIRQELGLSDDETPRVSLIKGQFKRNYEKKVKGKSKAKSNYRLVLVFLALCLLAYYFLN